MGNVSAAGCLGHGQKTENKKKSTGGGGNEQTILPDERKREGGNEFSEEAVEVLGETGTEYILAKSQGHKNFMPRKTNSRAKRYEIERGKRGYRSKGKKRVV